MKIIGLTGGIGSGKSEIAGTLLDLGVLVISADQVSHEVYRKGSDGWDDLVGAFGDQIIGLDGEIDRDKLSSIVFSNPNDLSKLNSLIHPRTRALIANRLDEARNAGETAVVIEAAVLLEAGWDDLVDEIWVSRVSEDQVVSRVVESRGLDASAVRARIMAQMSQKERENRADVVIDNTGDIDNLKKTVLGIWHERVNSRITRRVLNR